MDDNNEQGQADEVDGTQDAPDISQETPTQDSGLQTPQPDQPVPTEAERQEQANDQAAETAPVEDQGASYPSNEDQQAQADQREAELESERREHAERTGGGYVNAGELQAQRDEHNARTAGERS